MYEIFLYFDTFVNTMADNPFIVALLGFATFGFFVSLLKSLLRDDHTISSDKDTVSFDKNKVSLDKDTVSFNEKHNTRTQIYLNGEPYYLDD